MSCPVELVEREDRLLHGPILRPDFLGEAEFLERLAGHHLRGELGKRAANRLADEGHRAAGARIHFQHIHHLALHGVLHVHQADDLQLTRHRVRVGADGVDDRLGERVRRQNHRGIAGVNARELDVLQHPADDDGAIRRVGELAAVRDAIHVHLGRILQKAVHQHWALRTCLHRSAYVTAQIRLRMNAFHSAPTEHKGGPHQHRISNPCSYFHRLGFIRRGSTRRLTDSQFIQHRRKQLSVLRNLNALGRSSDDGHPRGREAVRQIQRSLPPELHDHSPRLLLFTDI